MEKTLILKNDIAEISRLSEFIEKVGEEFMLTPDLVFNLNLVLEEAVSNVILYAYPKEVYENITLSLKKDDNMLIFVLTDSGKEFDPTMIPDADVTLSAEQREIGGLGIFLIRQIMNTVEYQRIEGRNVLTLRKEI